MHLRDWLQVDVSTDLPIIQGAERALRRLSAEDLTPWVESSL